MPHRAVFFDFGGTLFSYTAVRDPFEALLERIGRHHGLEAGREELRRAYRAAMARSFAEFLTRPFYLHRELFAHAQGELLRTLGAKASGAPGDHLYSGQTELGRTQLRLREDARDTLEALRDQGLHLSIVSNIDDDQFEPLWAALGLAPLFDATTTSEEARSCKPDPGIFRLALAKAGDPPPEEVVFVGDSQHHDVAGAAPFGMTTVLLARTPPAGEPRPDFVIGRLGELLGIVRA